MQPIYDPEAVRPMWEELAQCGVEPTKSSEDVDEAQDYLRASIEAGFKRWNQMETDADLRNLRESGLYAELLREYNR